MLTECREFHCNRKTLFSSRMHKGKLQLEIQNETDSGAASADAKSLTRDGSFYMPTEFNSSDLKKCTFEIVLGLVYGFSM